MSNMSVCEAGNLILYRVTSNIKSEDRKKRKEALDEFYKIFFEGSPVEGITLEEGFQEVRSDVFKCLYDASEAVRESSINVLDEIVKRSGLSEDALSELITILRWRLGEHEVKEPSEEVRLRLVTFINNIVSNVKEGISALTVDLVQILTKTLTDRYPKVRQESCKCVEILACVVPRHFYEYSTKLIRPVLFSFNHQHFKMRIAAVETLGIVIKHGNSKNLPNQELFGSLAERLFDSNPTVRSAVTKVLGDWLINWHDRYSFFPRMVPIILSSLCDVLPELREEAWQLWDKAGLQYEQENEQELKDKMDFLSEKPEHYPKNVVRPNLGCRTLVQRNTCHIISALSRELDDWKVDIQIKSAQLLCWVVLHAESDITQHTEGLLRTMYRACNHTDSRIVENLEKAAEYMAHFITPNTYMKLVMRVLDDACTPGHLCVFSALIRGTRQDLLEPHFDSIAGLLSSDMMCKNRNSLYQFQILKCCEALIDSGCEKRQENMNKLFVTVISVKGLSSKPETTNFAQDVLVKLSSIESGGDVFKLYENYAGPVLEKMIKSVDVWTTANYDHQILLLMLEEGGPGIGAHLSNIFDVLKIALRPKSDVMLKSKFFTSLSKTFCRRDLAITSEERDYYRFIKLLIHDCICPNLVWRAGRSAEALRTVVLATLCALVLPQKELPALFDIEIHGEGNLTYFDIISKDEFEEIFTDVFPLLVNSIEDSAVKSRLFSLKLIQFVMVVARQKGLLTPDCINNTYPILLKRLDDVSDNVRMESVKTLAIVYSNLPESYNPQTYRPHLESLFSTMLIHLDDPNLEFRQLMTEALKMVGKTSPLVLYDKLDGVKERFRNHQSVSEILDYLEAVHKDCEEKGTTDK